MFDEIINKEVQDLLIKIHTNSLLSSASVYNIFSKDEIGRLTAYGQSVSKSFGERILKFYQLYSVHYGNSDELIPKIEHAMKCYLIHIWDVNYIGAVNG